MAAIDRDYWLDFARDGVTKSIDSREKAADRLDTFLIWVWGIYTSVFALASFLNFLSSNIMQLLWVAQPVLIIMLARFSCVMVSMPSSDNDPDVMADPNDVASIIDSFQVLVKKKKRKLLIAQLLSLLSILSLSSALVGYNYYDANNKIKQELDRAKIQFDLKEKSPKESPEITAAKATRDSLDLEFKNEVKRKMLQDLKQGDLKHLDALKGYAQ